MACHTPHLDKAKKQGEIPYPASVPSHLNMQNLGGGMGLRLGVALSLVSLFFERQSMTGHP